ncbi:DNA polymerase III subunit alpha [Vagococcus sp. DIV0080]|uniref:DNA polymerase III subunit alpha n=1 Tax=Candidatus Vagococcus giribetii TaxID=2230876 RepID=A0ABS3HT16_9ENTE|nr:DNA polymerase III subunit alpha [Vagococcus sp. DIV0080]MBO0476801.1 DNA polymerase III subunit alpha [Vagococcus sp. DIV0080]
MNLGQLQVLTSYSLLKSTNDIPNLVSTSKELGYQSLAITDINAMHGVIEFYKTCLKEGIKPIIGLTLTYHSKQAQNQEFELILLAKNLTGYEQLLQISTLRMEREESAYFYLEEVEHYLEGIIGISPSSAEKSELLYCQQQDQALFEKEVKYLQALFAAGDFYQGLVIHQRDELTNKAFFERCQAVNLEIVALSDVRYLVPSDHFSVSVLRHIDSGEKIQVDVNQTSGPYFLPSKEGFEQSFKEASLNQALANNEAIVSKCQLTIPLNQTLLPSFPIENGASAKELLEELCLTGLGIRHVKEDPIYLDRLKMELSVIHDMGFDDYFLIVWDVMKYARDHEIVTACRGSAAGSLVSYALQITNVDPIAYGLLFERFLNKERYTMPDIDMDIPDNRREELLQYVNKKYGYHKVAQIATFGTLAAKMALRDVSRVFGLNQNEASAWANAVPNVLKITLEQAFNQSAKLRELVGHSEKNTLLFETAKKIEGLPRHVSTHAAGVVISDQELTEFIPLQTGTNNIPLTQLAMGEVEEIGLLKMDFLGLRNLSIIGNTLESIKYLYNKTIDLEKIPLDDEETLKLFRQGATIGVFQFESEGIKKVLRKLGPTSIEDIASVNALYRPGPMENIDLFVNRKKGKEPIVYPHKNLEPILGYTYGVIVYQEQIMQIASLMAGFSLGQADILRRAISKKKKDVLDTERDHFVKGSIEQGYTKEVAEEVYQYIERFANYGFNRSHAVVYAVLAYQMTYLKVHYPECFFSSLLHSVRNNPAKIKEYMNEAKKFDVKILPPDINKSDYSFKLYKGNILFGFSSLKGIRKDFIQHIVTVRKEGGTFSSLENFLIRINGKWLKEGNILPLIYIGAFDSLHGNRKQLVMDLDSLIRNIEYSGGSMDLLDVLSLKKDQVADFTLEEKLNQEAEYLGSYVSGHPVDGFSRLKKGRQIRELVDTEIGDSGQFLVYVTQVKKIRTKKGESMAFLSVNDGTKEMDVTIFPKLFRQINQDISENKVYLISGKVTESQYNKMPQLLADKLEFAENVPSFEGQKKCYIKISKENDQLSILNQLKQTLMLHKGDCPVILVFDTKNRLLDDTFWVEEKEEVISSVFKILGNNTIIFQ